MICMRSHDPFDSVQCHSYEAHNGSGILPVALGLAMSEEWKLANPQTANTAQQLEKEASP